MENQLNFFSEDISFKLENKDSVADWILSFLSDHGEKAGEINYIFCTDEYLLNINRTHLNHDYYTDIITFPWSPHMLPTEEIPVFADIFISIDRVRDNANTLQLTFEDELHRVMIHGILHLIGLDDHTEDGKEEMRKAEDEALSRREFI